MKKIIALILLMFIFQINIKAETIYGEYHKVDKLTKMNEDEILIKKIKLYNSFNTKIVDKGYLLENNKYEKNINDYILKTYKTYQKNIATTEYYDIYYTIGNKEITYIYLDNIAKNTVFNEIKIYNNNEEINYLLNSNKNNIESLNDNNYLTTYKILDKSEIIKLELKEKIYLKNLKIELITDSKKYLNISIPEYIYNLNVNFTSQETVNKHIINIIDSNEKRIDRYFLETYKLYRYLEYIKEPTNIYVKKSNNIIEEDYKIEEEYYQRNKLVLKEDLTINNELEKVDKFVLYASDIVFINCNINYKINGIYDCNYKLNDISINKKININIPTNNKVIKQNINNFKNIIGKNTYKKTKSKKYNEK